MADENDSSIGRIALFEQEIDKRLTVTRIQRRRGFIGNELLRRADERSSGGHTLLLSHTQCYGGLSYHRSVPHPQLLKQTHRFPFDTGRSVSSPASPSW